MLRPDLKKLETTVMTACSFPPPTADTRQPGHADRHRPDRRHPAGVARPEAAQSHRRLSAKCLSPRSRPSRRYLVFAAGDGLDRQPQARPGNPYQTDSVPVSARAHLAAAVVGGDRQHVRFPRRWCSSPTTSPCSAPGGIDEVLQACCSACVDNPISALMNANFIGILAWAIGMGIAIRHAGETTRTGARRPVQRRDPDRARSDPLRPAGDLRPGGLDPGHLRPRRPARLRAPAGWC